ncbi:MAG: nucleotidyltransferase family protein, partial [Vicinamibacteria bacterium]
VGVDLHWSLVGHDTDRRAPSLDWFRARSCGSRLDATAHLLYLAAHMKLQHYDERVPLLWLCDFCLLSRSPSLDFDELFEAARSFGWEAALAATCAEVEKRLGVELPAPLASPASEASAPTPAMKGGPERAWNELSTLSFQGRAALIKAYLLPSPSYVRFKYRPRPHWAWPLCYPLRWARLLASAASLVARPRRSRLLLSHPR